jgi:hypothetical protein
MTFSVSKNAIVKSLEIELMYFDGHIVIYQEKNLRFLKLAAADVATTINQFQHDNMSGAVVPPAPLGVEFSGIISPLRIVGAVHNYLRKELVFVIENDKNAPLTFQKLVINKDGGADKRQFSMVPYQAPSDPRGQKKANQLRQKLPTNIVHSEVHQICFIPYEGIPFILVLRKNQQLELIYNFSEVLQIEQKMNVAKILGSFGDKITYQFHDQSIA